MFLKTTYLPVQHRFKCIIICNIYINIFINRLFYSKLQRVTEMKKERIKQVMRGERSLNNFYDKVKPPRDSLQFGPFHP